ncbi:type II secretion system F family protein [Budvicia diplopodorum]|uniref:type II secretion system F family protein n=1 Tax=Budvicia diplopodorum TaxID=1119056 RepID=UPI001357EEC3|nr:type II secretion system F family protein [Budvicia diplopodorum]
MVIIYYLALIVVGIVFLLVQMRERKHFHQVKRVIESEDLDPQIKLTPTAEYEVLIESNNQAINFFAQLDKHVNYKLMIACIVALLLYLLNLTGVLSLTLENGAVILTVVLATVIVLPAMIRKYMINARTRIMMNDIPYFIDLIAVCIQAGMTIESSLRYVADHFSDINRDLSKTVDRVIRRSEVKGLESALKELYYTLPTLEIKMFCTTLQQSVYFGTSVYEQLMDLSKDIRDLQLLTMEEKVGNLSAKMSIPLILFVMFPIVILIAAPGLLRILFHV